jgi:hypothetical protein
LLFFAVPRRRVGNRYGIDALTVEDGRAEFLARVFVRGDLLHVEG